MSREIVDDWVSQDFVDGVEPSLTATVRSFFGTRALRRFAFVEFLVGGAGGVESVGVCGGGGAATKSCTGHWTCADEITRAQVNRARVSRSGWVGGGGGGGGGRGGAYSRTFDSV